MSEIKYLSNVAKGSPSHEIGGKIIGRPQATEKYTVEELEEMGYVGIYGPGRSSRRVIVSCSNCGVYDVLYVEYGASISYEQFSHHSKIAPLCVEYKASKHDRN